LICAEWNAGAAAPDANHNFVNEIRACMWKRDAVFNGTGVGLLTRQHLFEKSFSVGDPSGVREQLHDLANRIRRFARAQS